MAATRGRQSTTWAQRRFLVVLGLPTLALALGATTVASYVPVLLRDFTGPLVAGALLATEGVFALFVPTVVGRMSDRTRTPLGARLPFLLVAAPLAALGLFAAPFAGSLLLIALAIAVFYVAYFLYFTPYMALYPDLVDDELAGRAQGSVGAWREVGLGLALVGGGLLISLWRPLPFVVAAVVILALTALFVWRVRGAVAAGRRPVRAPSGGRTRTRDAAQRLLRERPDLRAALGANALWETALSALRAFVVLFFIEGLGRSPSFASAVLGGVVVAAFVAAPVAGTLADRFGHQRVILASLWVYAIGLTFPVFTTDPWVIAVLPAVAFAATTVMTLPFALIMRLLPREGDHGVGAGLFGVSRGVGLLAGPLLAGAAISASGGLFADTKGYAAVFAVGALVLFASIPLVRRTQTA